MLPKVVFSPGFINCSYRGHLTKNEVPIVSEKKDKWMGDVKKSVERRGTKGICTGKNKGRPGGPCPKGSRQYALAQTFAKASKKSK